jgi:phosphomannomutase
MNRKVVLQTSAGFAAFLWERHRGSERDADAIPPSCVVGFDARELSEVFAEDVASVLAGAGITVTLLAGPCPTPLLAFAVRHLDVCAGVMITASHNPPRDNGYKVYLGGPDAGSQIAPPVDARIAALIETAAAAPLAAIPRAASFARDGVSVREAYIAATVSNLHEGADALAAAREPDVSSLRCVYTAMHGVGFELTSSVFARAGLPELVSVAAQQSPDGGFPTVAFPNPEEPGALDLARGLAAQVDADLIIAHDPDADRLGVALPARVVRDHSPGECSSESCECPQRLPVGGAFTQLSGNELGLLLGWECAERWVNDAAHASTRDSGQPGSRGTLAATVVSSPALQAVASAFGLDFVQTLSGFKWVSRVPNLVFGFEEALGYLVNPGVVHDKDGISAAALIVQMAQQLHEQGKTLWDRLDEASDRFGHFASDQVTIRMDDHAAVEAMSARIRSTPPTAFGGVAVTAFTDYLRDGGMPVPANVMRFDLADGSRVMIRPSGTEPKLKIYLDAFSDEGSAAHRAAAAEQTVANLRQAAEALVADIATER